MRELSDMILMSMFHILIRICINTDACICQDSSKSILIICAFYFTSKQTKKRQKVELGG